ncbi:hypothetical protein [Hymenobacter weizhouensis]|uniref:hypothetical protein n=1 Tax=Hymenobacter sp. YIM 151500-1 TaxID=2987689 RepID=UPI0022268699|nr:hypothetical protein [Hymenobacter sp. YIM 151500-1]UYZ61961.1 hypothetical protein OIS53_13225 [Hymenobacter sp. YIM 151500-1]
MPQGQATLPAQAYDWVIPRGWRHEDGTVSDGATPRRYNRSGAFEIIVTTSGDTGGTISVRAIDTTCDPNATRTTLATREETRQLPTVCIGSNGAPATIFCGDQTDYGFRADVSGSQPGGRITGYAWSVLGAGWNLTNASAATPTIIPSGTSGATITLVASYERNGFSATLRAPDAVLSYSQQLPTPVFVGSNFDLCLNQRRRYEVRPIRGSVSYRWTATPASLIPGGSATTTVPYLDVTGPNTDATASGQVRVEVSNAAFGCASNSATVNFQIGAGSAILRSSANYYGAVCPYAPVVFEVERANARGQDNYAWYVNG